MVVSADGHSLRHDANPQLGHEGGGGRRDQFYGLEPLSWDHRLGRAIRISRTRAHSTARWRSSDLDLETRRKRAMETFAHRARASEFWRDALDWARTRCEA